MKNKHGSDDHGTNEVFSIQTNDEPEDINPTNMPNILDACQTSTALNDAPTKLSNTCSV